MSLLVKKLHEDAQLPKLAHKGEDIAYDLFALEDTILLSKNVTKIRTGIAIEFTPSAGAILKTRSSMAEKGIDIRAGVLDAGYRGEIIVMLYYSDPDTLLHRPIQVKKGDKIAQMIKTPIATDEVVEVTQLTESKRGEKGFGSSGR